MNSDSYCSEIEPSDIRVFSFGGGVQSTACLVLAAERKIDFPLFVFANTGDDAENPSTLEYLHSISIPYAEKHGLKIEIITSRFGSLYQHLMEDGYTISIPVKLGANGPPAQRKCTRDWKIRPVAKYVKALGGTKKRPATVGIGISTDEVHRIKDSLISWQCHEFPLIEMMLSRNDCVEIIKKSGLPNPGKSSCWFCPFKPFREWRKMATEEPELFEKACQLEEHLSGKLLKRWNEPVYMTSKMKSLRECVLPDDQLKLFPEDEECSGYCHT